MSVLCPSAARAATLTGCGGAGAAVTNKTGYTTSAIYFPSPNENIHSLSRLVNTQASVICVSFLNLLPPVLSLHLDKYCYRRAEVSYEIIPNMSHVVRNYLISSAGTHFKRKSQASTYLYTK